MTPKQKLDQLEREESRAEGRLEQLTQTLQKEFKEYGCKDFEHAKRLLKSLQREEQKLNEQCMEAEQEFESKWDEVLREEDSKVSTGERTREASSYYRKRTTGKG